MAQTGSAGEGAGPGAKTKKYFLSPSSTVDRLIVGKKKTVLKKTAGEDPVELTEDEVKDAQKTEGVRLTAIDTEDEG